MERQLDEWIKIPTGTIGLVTRQNALERKEIMFEE